MEEGEEWGGEYEEEYKGGVCTEDIVEKVGRGCEGGLGVRVERSDRARAAVFPTLGEGYGA